MQNALKWDQVHVIGHSMGAMVATQLACMHPDRLLSLTLISATAGRWQSIPTNWAAVKYAWQVSSSALFSDPAPCTRSMQIAQTRCQPCHVHWTVTGLLRECKLHNMHVSLCFCSDLTHHLQNAVMPAAVLCVASSINLKAVRLPDKFCCQLWHNLLCYPFYKLTLPSVPLSTQNTKTGYAKLCYATSKSLCYAT